MSKADYVRARLRGPHAVLALRLAARIFRSGMKIRTDGRKMHKIRNTCLCRFFCDKPCALRLNGREFLPTALGQHANQINYGIRTLNRSRNGIPIP